MHLRQVAASSGLEWWAYACIGVGCAVVIATVIAGVVIAKSRREQEVE